MNLSWKYIYAITIIQLVLYKKYCRQIIICIICCLCTSTKTCSTTYYYLTYQLQLSWLTLLECTCSNCINNKRNDINCRRSIKYTFTSKYIYIANYYITLIIQCIHVKHIYLAKDWKAHIAIIQINALLEFGFKIISNHITKQQNNLSSNSVLTLFF